ncbi:MAG: class I SAM-dependent methyltransferase [Acidobacteria bacterium]|nr:class I SAM-dependent methyltransferase [Acidobacteriota bacterium]MBI3281655.1 class I SAM-dependent methyltransferase [Acidobacteriota bacterium]
MTYSRLPQLLPRFLRRQVLHFEAAIEDAVTSFAAALPAGALVLDAGAGEGRHEQAFARQRYIAVDLGIGDEAWSYARLDAVADLHALPFRERTFDACINIVTLEHVREPRAVLKEIARGLRPGAPLLMVVPHEWEEHQQPHDYYRFTRYGVQHLLEQAGFGELRIAPAGGYFRLLSRRLLNGLQFLPAALVIPAALLVAPAALLVSALDPLDKRRNFTLGFICTGRKL